MSLALITIKGQNSGLAMLFKILIGPCSLVKAFSLNLAETFPLSLSTQNKVVLMPPSSFLSKVV